MTSMRQLLSPPAFRKKYAKFIKSGCQSVMAESNREHLKRVMNLLPENAFALEIGCFKGGTSVWLLENGVQVLHVIDTFKGSPEHAGMDLSNLECEFIMNTLKYCLRLSVLKGPSAAMLCILPQMLRGQKYDLIYVDASHDSRDVITDVTLGFKLLKSGGVMIMDDYLWSFYDDRFRNPKPAIDFFLGAFAGELRVIESAYQVSIQKL